MDPSTEAADDVALLARAQGGDRVAFAGLYDRHVRPVYWQAYSVVRDADEAEEVTQDVFVTTWPTDPRHQDGRRVRAAVSIRSAGPRRPRAASRGTPDHGPG